MAKIITDINELDFNKTYTYADYISWQFDEIVELIKGKIFRMSPPSPNLDHQRSSSKLHTKIGNYLSKQKCELFSAPFDVYLTPENAEKATIVQPDLCVVCDIKKLDQRGCKGAPDLIVEILSKSTAKKDVDDKFKLYEANGVREYWIVHPKDQTILQYFLDIETKKYILKENRPFTSSESISSYIFPDLIIDLQDIFQPLE